MGTSFLANFYRCILISYNDDDYRNTFEVVFPLQKVPRLCDWPENAVRMLHLHPSLNIIQYFVYAAFNKFNKSRFYLSTINFGLYREWIYTPKSHIKVNNHTCLERVERFTLYFTRKRKRNITYEITVDSVRHRAKRDVLYWPNKHINCT